MRHALLFDAESCSGCLSCVINCALRNEGVNSPASARIHIEINPFEGIYPATFCRQCTKAPCAAVCPVDAIQRHESKEYWYVDYELCIGCRDCVEACPFGAMFFDPNGDKVLKCETCQGDPICVESCPTQALIWGDITDRSPLRNRTESD
jgi:anaerobic carbon-monoxide dehydrogenase iron sulfur subunit